MKTRKNNVRALLSRLTRSSSRSHSMPEPREASELREEVETLSAPEGQMREVRNVRQIAGEPHRRWFSSEDFDLIVWYDEDRICGFQYCYDVRSNQHALTWLIGQGFSHHRVDEGDDVPGKAKTPILLTDGHFDNVKTAERFQKVSENVDPRVRRLVYRTLMEYPR